MEEKNKGGRPEVQFDMGKVETMGALNCSHVEMADEFGCSDKTIFRRMQDVDGEFYKAYRRGQSKFKISLRQEFFNKCQQGNLSAMIHMSRQVLDHDAPAAHGVVPGSVPQLVLAMPKIDTKLITYTPVDEPTSN